MEGFSKPKKEREIPRDIQEAIIRGDTDFLRAAGKKGGQRAALKREVKTLLKQMKEQELLAGMEEARKQRNGDFDHDDNLINND